MPRHTETVRLETGVYRHPPTDSIIRQTGPTEWVVERDDAVLGHFRRKHDAVEALLDGLGQSAASQIRRAAQRGRVPQSADRLPDLLRELADLVSAVVPPRAGYKYAIVEVRDETP